MERISPDAADTNAFSNMATRVQQVYNDAHADWQTRCGDVRMGRCEYLPEKMVPCGHHT